jgi:PBP1b-binding outer membrane lipoprotein LpoB
VADDEPAAHRRDLSVLELDGSAHRLGARDDPLRGREVEGQQNAVFNPAHTAKYGRQLGAKYLITGKVSGNDERTEDMRRVQYFLYMQVLEVETSAIRWQGKTEITKAVR